MVLPKAKRDTAGRRRAARPSRRVVGGLCLAAVITSVTDAAPSTYAASAPRRGEVAAAKPHAQYAPRATPRRLLLPFVSVTRAAPTVAFGVARGIRHEPFSLALRTSVPGAVVRYTLDFSEPSAANGHEYSRPLLISTTSVVRAAAFVGSRRVSDVTTHSYLYPRDAGALTEAAALGAGFPGEWGTYGAGPLEGRPVAASYGLDPTAAAGPSEVQRALEALPSVSIAGSMDDVFGPQGLYSNPLVEDLEVPISVEILGVQGAPSRQLDCGLRVAGGWSRRPDVTPKHSFSLRFRSRYGPARLEYPLFPESEVTSFDTLRLRAGQADSFPYFAYKAQYLHDQWARDTQRAMGHLSANGRFVHLYVNSLYWGLYNLTEEPTAAFASDHLGNVEEAWDTVKDGGHIGGEYMPEVEDGSLHDFRRMQGIVDGRPDPHPGDAADEALYEELAALLDLEQHIDYVLLQIYGANVDWPHKNYRAMRDRDLPDRFQFLVWDYEHTTALRDEPGRGFCQTRRDPDTGECGYVADTSGVGGLHGWLARFPAYRLAFADRAHRHLFGRGALTPSEAASRYAALAEEVEQAIVAEAARWGTARPEPQAKQDQAAVWNQYTARISHGPQTREMWLVERDRLLAEFFPARTQAVLGQLCRRGLYPSVNAPEIVAPAEPDDAPSASGDSVGSAPGAPVDRQAGRPVGAATISILPGTQGCPRGMADGRIYYTVDGSDPREALSGAASPAAAAYTGPFHVSGHARLMARAVVDGPSGPVWSALAELTVGTPDLRVTEIMYHPPSSTVPEFVEVQNLGRSVVDVASLELVSGVRGSFRVAGQLPPNGHAVVTNDVAAFRAAYPGVALAGAFAGRLDNTGEEVVLAQRSTDATWSVTYDNDGFWPRGADGLGYSLVAKSAWPPASHADSWRASTEAGGSPGRRDPEPQPGRDDVVPVEVLANPSKHQEDAVELHNRSSEWVDIGGWYLSDDPGDLDKYRIPAGTRIAPAGYRVLYRASFGADPKRGFGLASEGEEVLLSASDPSGDLTGAIQALRYGASEEGVSWGRLTTAMGVFAAPLTSPTFGVASPSSVSEFRTGQGAPNARPRVGPVILNEIMSRPVGRGLAFIELLNVGAAVVELGGEADDLRPWRLAGAASMTFPPGTSLEPGDLMLVVPGDPDAFRATQTVPADVQVLGPCLGTLDSIGGSLTLWRPATLGDGAAGAAVPADSVRFADTLAKQSQVVGGGVSLERVRPTAFGNDPANWASVTTGGTPGRRNAPGYRLHLPLAVAGR